jgi:hypothetical protein
MASVFRKMARIGHNVVWFSLYILELDERFPPLSQHKEHN